MDPSALGWPCSRLAEALSLLSRHSGNRPKPTADVAIRPDLASQSLGVLGAWIESTATALGVETEPIVESYAQAQQVLLSAGPALVPIPDPDGFRLLLVLGGHRRTISVLAPDLKIHAVPVQRMRQMRFADVEASVGSEVDAILSDAQIPDRRRQKARTLLLQEVLENAHLPMAWLVRRGAGAPVTAQLRASGALRDLAMFLLTFLGEFGLSLAAWVIVADVVIQGRFDAGRLLAWVLMLLTLVPLQLAASFFQGRFAIRLTTTLQTRMIHGAMRLDPERIRHEGAGQMLGRVIESEAVGSLALNAGLGGVMGLIQAVAVVFVLANGAGGMLHASLFLGWMILATAITLRWAKRYALWTKTRLSLTHDLVERMVGHRTRLAQEAPERWHEGEDQAVNEYLETSSATDKSSVWLTEVVPRGWLLLGLGGLVAPFVVHEPSTTAVAIGLGGILLGYTALGAFVSSVVSMTGAWIAWKQARMLYVSGVETPLDRAGAFVPMADKPPAAGPPAKVVVEASKVSFRYANTQRLVLDAVDLRICAGDRVLLEGPSGGGKSTLGMILCGLRQPESGLVLLKGLDRATLGARGWGKRITAAPQFHDNRVYCETFAFNVLMGRGWPASPDEMQEAEGVCRELGLGPLLDRTPSGMLQIVGETGWRLSHGEQSRLFIARALLQKADVVVLDESFGALDPESLQQSMQCVLKHAPTVLVIAHP